MLENKKRQARLSIIEKLRKNGMPTSPFPGDPAQDVAMVGEQEVEEDSLDQLGDSLLQGLEVDGKPVQKKKRPVAP